MKTLKFSFALVFALFVGIVGRADVPQSLPINSLSALRGYAIEQARGFDVSVNSNTQFTYTYVNRDWEAPKTSGEIISLIAASDLTGFSVENPKDVLWLYGEVSNKDGDTLFYSHNSIQPVLVGSVWSLPSDAGVMKLALADTVPLFFEGAEAAQVSYKDSSGRTSVWENVRVSDGKIYFPKALAGKPVVLWIYGNASGRMVYSAETGKVITPTSLPLTLNPTIEGVFAFKDSNVSLQVPVSSSGVGLNPTLELSLTTAKTVIVSVVTSTLRMPTEYWYRAQGSNTWTKVMGGSVSLTLPAGVYYITPKWNEADLKDPVQPYYPYQPYYDGGKG